jgi:hypothetical protein
VKSVDKSSKYNDNIVDCEFIVNNILCADKFLCCHFEVQKKLLPVKEAVL